MTERANADKADKNVLVSGDSPRPGERQDTVMLSEVPDAATLLAAEPQSAALKAKTGGVNLSTAALAAVGQRYDILAEAGHGSMGDVYKARDRETGETVALKFLKPEIASDQAMMDRFKNELLFARKITHKNICRVHEFNRVGRVAYTTMEFVEGESLRSVLDRFGGLPLRKNLDLALQMCSGLKEAHAQGIIHRDLKPENVMIDAQGNVKIMDFGIARSIESLTRLTGSMVGTPAYMAPEQVGGKPVDYRTDIYSLGLMLYEMFTGTAAFSASTPIAVAMKQLREAPPLPHDVEPAIPVDIERVILKCIEKEPARRFQSVAELEQALRSVGMGSGTGTGATVGISTGTPAARPASQSGHGSASLAAVVPAAVISIPLKPPSRKPVYVSISIVLFAILAGVWGLHAAAVVKASKLIEPPASPVAPQPPDFALEKSIPEKEPDRVPGAEIVAAPPPTPAPKPKPVAHAPAKPAPPEVFPAVELPGRKPFSPPKRSTAGQTAQAAPSASSQAGQATGAQSYIWVGRYARRDKAQEAAKKMEDMSLPVVIIPRHLPSGEAFAVFTGPYNDKKIGGVIERLKAQGFFGAHSVSNPLVAQNPARK
jgi:serine/threonine protein kinase